MYSDEIKLINGCIEQDNQAWDTFVERYSRLISNAIVKTLRKYSYSTENQIVEDLFHTVFLSLIENNCRKFRKFKWKCKLSSWLHLITVRVTIDFLRKQTVHLSLNGETKEEMTIRETVSNGNPLPDKLIDMNEEKIIFEQIKKKLTPRERLFIELYYCRELSADECADALNTNKNNVYQMKNKIRDKLKEIVKKLI